METPLLSKTPGSPYFQSLTAWAAVAVTAELIVYIHTHIPLPSFLFYTRKRTVVHGICRRTIEQERSENDVASRSL